MIKGGTLPHCYVSSGVSIRWGSYLCFSSGAHEELHFNICSNSICLRDPKEGDRVCPCQFEGYQVTNDE